MKIDAVLARHPWPWEMKFNSVHGVWMMRDRQGTWVDMPYGPDIAGALLELVEAHVRAKAQGEASEAKP